MRQQQTAAKSGTAPRSSGNGAARDIFNHFGCRPIINACGVYTDLGGSILSDSVWASLTQLNTSFIDVIELLAKSGDIIAQLIGTEAARPTPGATAGIALAVAACMTSDDVRRGTQLPDTTGLRHKVVLQRGQAERYKYLNGIRMTGAQIVPAGSIEQTTRQSLQDAIDATTAALFVPIHLDGLPGTLPIEEIIAIGRERGIPTLIDAAYIVHPPQRLQEIAALGADLMIVSAKYYGGPNAGGFVAGRRKLIDAVVGLDFTRHESGTWRRFGRAFKMGRYEIAAVALALEEWFAADHAQLRAQEARRAEMLREQLGSRTGVTVELKGFTLDERLVDTPVNAAVLRFSRDSRTTAAEVCAALAAGTPSIRASVEDGALLIVTDTLRDAEIPVIAESLLRSLP